ncbi:MAG: conjugal transfer protein TraH [Candidatus Puniceispirillales bacterium WSBS_2018_MAG_OTU23]
MRFNLGIIVAAVLLIASPARADLSGDLRAFWDDLGGGISGTGPTSFEGQAAGYYTLGNLRARASTRVSSLTSFSLPSVDAGCGGIDLFGGSLSFISEDELIQLSKAIASNAVGYAFDLALETLSPVIAETMKDLRARLAELNLNNINSCEAAKGIVDSVWPKALLGKHKDCAELSVKNGHATDYAAAIKDCKTNAGLARSKGNASDDELEAIPENVNLAWHMMRGGRIDGGDWLKSDDQLSEFVQTLLGTVVITDSGPKHWQARIYEEGVFNALMEGGSQIIKVYTCSGDHDKCLIINPRQTTILQTGAIREQVRLTIDALIFNIQYNVELQPDDLDFINRTSIPLWRILNVYAASNSPIISVQSQNLVDIVATEVVLSYLNEIVDTVRARSGSSELLGTEVVTEWINSLEGVQRYLNDLEVGNSNRLNDALAIIERVEFIEQQLAATSGDFSGLGN